METKKLRVWHNSNFGHPAFNVKVTSIEEAKKILKVLANYDLYLGDLITDNAQGLETFVDNYWEEWENEDGENIEEVSN